MGRDIETICLRCLEKEPGRRYDSARAVADDLRRFLDGEAIATRPASTAEKTWRWCRRRPAVAALAGTLAMTLAAGFLSILVLWRRAEAARGRAEADSRTTNEVLSQIVEQTLPGSHLQVVNPDSLISNLQHTRGRLLAIAARQPDHPAVSRHLARVDRALGNALSQEKRLDEARFHFEESLRYFQTVLQHDPLDHVARSGQIVALLDSARIVERPEERLSRLRRAVDGCKELARLRPGATSIVLLAQTRDSLAGSPARRGDHEEARSLMAANRRMLEDVPGEAETPWVSAWRVFVQSDYDRFRTGPAPPQAAALRNDGPHHPGPLSRLGGPGADRLPAQDWAELAAQSLCPAARRSVDPAQEVEAGCSLVSLLAGMAAEQRNLGGTLDEARRTPDRMLALGRLLVAKYPRQPAAHLALSEAYTQLYKNAWRTNDRRAVKCNMRLALDAALQAQVLDPDSERARYVVDQRQRRLKDLLHPK